MVAKIEAQEPITPLEARIMAGGGSPLGGAKPKALIEIDGEQWVVKFFNNEPVDTPLIEHATMTLEQRAGINVARTQVIPLAGANALAVRRFDRQGGRRIHGISAGTALRAATTSGAEPEMGYPELARILRRVGITQDGLNERDACELFRRMVFNILIDNTDDHEKNHALLVTQPFVHGAVCGWHRRMTSCRRTRCRAGRSSSAVTWVGIRRWRTRCRNATRSACFPQRRPPRPLQSSTWSAPGRRTSRRPV